MKKTESILQTEKVCYITGDDWNLHRHHVYGGIRRRASEEWGCWVWLRGDWHNLADYGVHNDREFDARLKADCQREFERLHGHDCFMAVFGKNYLDEEALDAQQSEPAKTGASEPASDDAGSFTVLTGTVPF